MIAHWDWMASKYEKLYGLDSPRNWDKLDRKAILMIDYTRMCRSQHVLEVACGTGVFTRRFASTGAYIHAIDTSPGMLSHQKPLLHVYPSVMDATNTKFRDNEFHSVVGGYALQWINLYLLFREAYRVLKPGGRVAFITDNGINPVAFTWRLINFVDSLSKDRIYPSLMLPWVIKSRLKSAGFKNIVVQPIEFVHDRRVNTFLESVPVLKEFGGSLFIGAEK